MYWGPATPTKASWSLLRKSLQQQVDGCAPSVCCEEVTGAVITLERRTQVQVQLARLSSFWDSLLTVEVCRATQLKTLLPTQHQHILRLCPQTLQSSLDLHSRPSTQLQKAPLPLHHHLLLLCLPSPHPLQSLSAVLRQNKSVST